MSKNKYVKILKLLSLDKRKVENVVSNCSNVCDSDEFKSDIMTSLHLIINKIKSLIMLAIFSSIVYFSLANMLSKNRLIISIFYICFIPIVLYYKLKKRDNISLIKKVCIKKSKINLVIIEATIILWSIFIWEIIKYSLKTQYYINSFYMIIIRTVIITITALLLVGSFLYNLYLFYDMPLQSFCYFFINISILFTICNSIISLNKATQISDIYLLINRNYIMLIIGIVLNILINIFIKYKKVLKIT